MQWLADFIDRPVLRATQAELSALGVAHLAGLQAGLWTKDALRAMNRNSDLFTPSLSEVARNKQRNSWLSAVSRARLRHLAQG